MELIKHCTTFFWSSVSKCGMMGDRVLHTDPFIIMLYPAQDLYAQGRLNETPILNNFMHDDMWWSTPILMFTTSDQRKFDILKVAFIINSNATHNYDGNLSTLEVLPPIGPFAGLTLVDWNFTSTSKFCPVKRCYHIWANWIKLKCTASIKRKW